MMCFETVYHVVGKVEVQSVFCLVTSHGYLCYDLHGVIKVAANFSFPDVGPHHLRAKKCKDRDYRGLQQSSHHGNVPEDLSGGGPKRLNMRTVPMIANARKPARTNNMGAASGRRSGWRLAWTAKLIVTRMTAKRAQPNQTKYPFKKPIVSARRSGASQ